MIKRAMMQELNKRKAFVWAAALAAGFVLCGGFLSLVAKQQLKTALNTIPGAEVQVGSVHLSLLAGNVELKDVAFALRDTTDAGPDIEGSIQSLRLQHVRWFRLRKGEARADRLLLREPVARVLLKASPKEEPDTTRAQESFLKKITLAELTVEDGWLQLRNLADSTRASAQKINFSVSEIALDLPESAFAFNDSTYRVALDSLDFRDAPGLTRYEIGHLATYDAGPIEAQGLHLYNCVRQEEVAERMGKVASVWFDVKLDSLATSAINIPRMVRDKRITLDDIHIAAKEATIFQDDRYPPAVPYATIQEGINAVEWPLQINHIDARLDTFTFIWETTHINRGAFPMHRLQVSVNSVSNTPDNVMKMTVKAGRPTHSRLVLAMSVRNDKRETTQGEMHIYTLEASKLDAFSRPLFGATVQANFHQMDCRFKGDKHRMTSDFCMLYDQLAIKAWNDVNAPIQFVSKNSGLATFLANLLVPKANPAYPGKAPKQVAFTFERNPMQPYPAYLIQNLTGGMLHTMLPGGKMRPATKKK